MKHLVDERAACAVRLANLDRLIAHALLAAHQDGQPEDVDRLLDLAEAAARLSVKHSYDLIRRDAVPVIRIGKLIPVRLTTIIEIETGKRRLA